jgi:hypothetical protein
LPEVDSQPPLRRGGGAGGITPLLGMPAFQMTVKGGSWVRLTLPLSGRQGAWGGAA